MNKLFDQDNVSSLCRVKNVHERIDKLSSVQCQPHVRLCVLTLTLCFVLNASFSSSPACMSTHAGLFEPAGQAAGTARQNSVGQGLLHAHTL